MAAYTARLGAIDERCAAAPGTAFRDSRLPIEQFKALVRDQFFVLLTERERGVRALGTLVPEVDERAPLRRLNVSSVILLSRARPHLPFATDAVGFGGEADACKDRGERGRRITG